MNRIIKFRIPYFHANNGSFSHFGYWGTIDHLGKPSLDHGCFTSPGSNGMTKGWHQQFTNLFDKNGKEVWEGDIIKWAFVNTGELDDDDKFYIEPVEWSDCGFFLDGGAPLTVAMDDCEVIGNIHESPELLNS